MAFGIFVFLPALLLFQGVVAYLVCFYLFRLWMPLPLIASAITFWWLGGELTTSYPIDMLLLFLLLPATFGAYFLSTTTRRRGFVAYAMSFVTMVCINYLCTKSALSHLGYDDGIYWLALCFLGIATYTPSLTALAWRSVLSWWEEGLRLAGVEVSEVSDENTA